MGALEETCGTKPVVNQTDEAVLAMVPPPATRPTRPDLVTQASLWPDIFLYESYGKVRILR